MENIFQIYLYICGVIIGLAILAGLIALLLNLICYAYQTIVGFDTFRRFLRKYNKEMQIAKAKSCKKCANYKTKECPNSDKCYYTENKPYFKKKEVNNAK